MTAIDELLDVEDYWDDPVVYDPTDPMWVDGEAAAAHAKVLPATLRVWKHKGLIRGDGRGRYSLRDVDAWLEQRKASKIRLSDTPRV